MPSPTILPDAYVEIVFNLGGAVTLAGPAFNGSQPARTVVGLLDSAIEMRYPPDVCTFGIRLHPARAAILLGVPAREVVNAVRPLGQMSAALDEQISSVFDVRPRIDTVEGREAIEAALIEHFRGRPT